jgi:hypothetical protein
MVSGRLAEAFAKNSRPKGLQDIVPMSLHAYADIFSETAFDSLPECCKWDHAIELECEPSPGFCKVYLMTLTEQTEMNIFLEEALATEHQTVQVTPWSPSYPLEPQSSSSRRKMESFALSRSTEL